MSYLAREETGVMREAGFHELLGPPERPLRAPHRRAGGPQPRRSFLQRLLGPYARHPREWTSRQIAFTTLAALALLYVGLYHPYWSRGGDSEVYLVIARNLVRGAGYTYNGQPVALVPPLWPLVLSGAMWLTSVVALLKLLMPALMLVFLGCAYCVLRRVASAWVCAASVALVGSLHGIVVLTLWFHSDALFLALSWAALLVAIQAGERHARGDAPPAWLWRAVVATLLLAGAIATRWPGVLWCPVVAAGFLHGRRLWPGDLVRRGRFPLVAAIASGAVAAVFFFALRWGLAVDPGQIDPRYDSFETGHYDLVNQHGDPGLVTHLRRLASVPEWLSVLYFSELGRHSSLKLAMAKIAALTIMPLAIAVIVGLRRRQWLWLGMAGAWLPVVATWPRAVDRYSAPVAPLLVCGTILGTVWLARQLSRLGSEPAPHPLRRALFPLRRTPYLVMAGPLLICLSYNAGRYGLEFWAHRDHGRRYEGGSQQSLNRIAAYIRASQPVTGGEVAVTRGGLRPGGTEADELERRKRVRLARRNVIFLTDTPAIDLAGVDRLDPNERWFLRSALRRNIRFVIERPNDRRVFVHLRDLPWHARATDLERRAEDYILYELITEVPMRPYFRRVDPGAAPEDVLLVPGLEDASAVGRKRAWLPIPYN